jgi:AraC-like DNA-binding protein
MSEQRRDPLEGFISSVHHHSLREILLDYEVAMVSCWYWRNSAGWSLAWRTCSDSFFLFPVFGEVRVHLESGQRLLAPGQFLMLPEGTPHAIELKKGFQRLEQISVHCHLHDRYGRSLLARFSSSFGRLPHTRESIAALKELACLMGNDPELGQPHGEMTVKELLAFQLRDGLLLKPFSPGDPRVSAVIQRMEQRLASPDLSVEELARGVEITSVQLRKVFRRATGVGPKHFLTTLRLRKATRLLRHTMATVKQVSVDCGFASDHYFHLAFRKEFDCTPSEYRKRMPSEV